MKWKTSDFDYNLPEELIAQTPLLDRTSSRMLVIHNTEKKYEDKHFYDIVDYLHVGDVLVRNNTRVIPARLFGTKEETGAHVELLLLRQLPDDIWECLVGNAKVVKLGTIVSFHDGRLRAECIEIGEKGLRKMRMIYDGIFNEILDELGNVPLPPYIKDVTLHVGLGTFRPMDTEDIEDHDMHSEVYYMSKEAADTLNIAKANGQRIFAIGTTSVRTLESVWNRFGKFEECSGETKLFIYPGYQWHTIDGMLTNFHLPKSTLIMMIASFVGYEFTLETYRHAVQEKYRFFSFGDCMLITNE